MGETREWWSNQYDFGAGPIGRNYHLTRDAADAASRNGAGEVSDRLRFRIHVRLKPEGAPKRYAGDKERAGWERDPDKARALAKQGIKYEAEPRERVVPSWLFA